MTQITEKKFTRKQALFDQLFQDTTTRLQKAVAEKDMASVLLSGGTTPGSFYDVLSHADIPWDKICLSVTDERWVPATNPASCEYLVRQTLMQNRAATARFFPLKSPPDALMDGYAITLDSLRQMPQPFDMVLLGMGLDGHVASLIPTAEDTARGLDPANKNICQYIRNPGGDYPRISMTVNSLLNVAQVTLLFFGVEKWAVYQDALHDTAFTWPVSHILHQDQTPVEIYWCP
ncbi:6-phosphogluconolactonase [Paremcibacter congregatus]|uniref:6-phosphogluconolactonase n=1 Tax=Paremcibacter congregatus TaxID=2043170 RepID=A0A2G4YRC1_9PROT|nr:6-phosphogluconolactonase [Paremcibacter congregatus]PHZ84820.1 6-phosphogluconolactonase [Paremcibacter congregatus]QDE26206.1 6-phosphogluconolactonase [Paremcibacter congregatus]